MMPNEGLNPDGTINLDVCSGNPEDGERQAEGFIRHDIEKFQGISIVCDLRELDQHVKEGNVKHLRASHCLEHFTIEEEIGRAHV